MPHFPQAFALLGCVPICLSRLQQVWMIRCDGPLFWRGAAGVLQRDSGCKTWQPSACEAVRVPSTRSQLGVILVEAQVLSDRLAQGIGSATQGPHLT